MSDTLSGLKIFSGNAHRSLASDVCAYLNLDLGASTTTRFADGEIRISVNESARGDDVYIIQPTCAPTNDNLMELLIMIDAFRRASAREINIVTPYFGYARQDKKIRPREPITARLVAHMLEVAGATRLIAVDLHAEQIQGFFDIPVDHLYAGPIIGRFYREAGYQDQDVVVVSPDTSGVSRAKNLAEYIQAPIAIIAKRRPEPNKVDIVEIIGDVRGKKCVMIDDMVDTGGSVITGAEALLKRGATEVEVASTHPVLSANASQRIQDSVLKRLVCLDTIPIPSEKMVPKMKILPVAPLIAEAIKRHHNNESVSELFTNWRSG